MYRRERARAQASSGTRETELSRVRTLIALLDRVERHDAVGKLGLSLLELGKRLRQVLDLLRELLLDRLQLVQREALEVYDGAVCHFPYFF